MLYSRKYGIEIEFTTTLGAASVAAAIVAAGVPCVAPGYTHRLTDSWKVVPDGSVSGGLELVSPPLQGAASVEQIRTVCRALAQIGASVNRSCGLHVHIEARGLDVATLRRLAVLYMESESVLDSWMPASRRGNANMYCNSLVGRVDVARLNRARDVNQIAEAVAGGNRYVKLNFTAFRRHGTVEFRHHSGTVDAEKIINWMLACQRLINCAQKESTLPMAVGATMVARPSNARLATIYDMMSRPGGCTREEVANVLGRTTLPPLARICREHGIAFRVVRGGRREQRYVVATGAAPTAASAAPVTFESFCDKLEMTAEEKQFWTARRQLIGTAGYAEAA